MNALPTRRLLLLATTTLVCLGGQAAKPSAKAPPVAAGPGDLVVELREVAEQGGGYSVSTAPQQAVLQPQQIRVRNGERGSLSVSRTMAMQWVRSVAAESGSLKAGGTSASSMAGGATNEVTFMRAGQSLEVLPSWSGKGQVVTVQVALASAEVAPRMTEALPDQSRAQRVTTVSALLGRWVTIAASGQRAQAGAYSSRPSDDSVRLIQLRVSAAP